MDPEVSVVIATKDRPAVLPRALDSVRAQSGVSVETIVVDDGSAPPAAVENGRLAGERQHVRLIRLDASRGPSAARNAGLERASGRLVCMLDDDNEFAPGKLAAQVRAIAGAGAKDAVAVTGVELLADGHPPERSLPTFRAPLRLDGAVDPFSILPARIFVHTYLLPTELLRRAGGYDERLRWGEHTELFLRLRETATFVGVAAIGTRVHRGVELEHASRDWPAKADGIRRIMEVHPDDFARSRSLRAEWLDVLGVTLLRGGDREAARGAFASAVAARPLRRSSVRHLLATATHTERILLRLRGGGRP
jgi:glycosyltransferase involved in cell wall biosynthesis